MNLEGKQDFIDDHEDSRISGIEENIRLLKINISVLQNEINQLRAVLTHLQKMFITHKDEKWCRE